MDEINDPKTPVEEEELYSAWALTILCVLLILSLWTSYYVQVKRIKAVHETVLSIFAGMFVGLIIRLSPGHLIREMLTFKHTLFFNLLLPPIILNSGYELKQDNFFRNFGTILTFAFVGTFISAVGLGVLVYIYSFLGLESLNLGLLECLIFGSTLSATDPVTILAIFNQHKVDPKLYSVIFGESILNDAVSIVMYETLSQFHGTDIYLSSFFRGVGIFLLSFSVSMALGVGFGLGCSLMLKHSSLTSYPGIESCLVALIAYTSYFFSNGMHMSGIVSLLFCGITLKHYAYHTMSRRTQRTTKYMFAVLAQLSENFIFIYLGLNLFTQDVQVFKPIFILVATAAYRRSVLNLADPTEGVEDDIGDADRDSPRGEAIRDLRSGTGTSSSRAPGRLSVPSTPRASSPRLGRGSGGGSPAVEGSEDAQGWGRRRDTLM
ncbi:monovalent cation:H+ antiporter, CPA1 (nhx1) [Ceratobasidium sp. 395]|nr:monovalent cation:H+ antiporter, CPA1 (nhx1) [Ceratobasidium sp. 395]